MTMSPSMIGAKMNDEAIIEAEIQQQLQMINLDAEDIEDGDIDILEGADVIAPDEDAFSEPLPDVEEYLACMRRQTDRFEQELKECDEILNHKSPDTHVFNEELYEISKELGEDPENLKKKILEELDKEDELYNINSNCQEETTLFITSETELLRMDQTVDTGEEEGKDEGEVEKENEINDGALVVSDEISNLERFLHEQLKAVDLKYRQREEQWKKDYQSVMKAEEEYLTTRTKEHEQVLEKMKAEEDLMIQQREMDDQKLAAEVAQTERKLNEEASKFEEKIAKMVSDLEKEQVELHIQQRVTQEKLDEKRDMCALKIQSWYRGTRVRKIYGSDLKEKRLNRQKMKELERIKEIDIEIERRKEEQRKEEEEKRQKQEEEIQRQKAEELMRKETEKKKKEEQEKKKKEEEERKRKEKEERKQKEEEEKRRKEEERKKKEEEERKRQEEEKNRKEEEKKRKEEEKKKKEEEKKRKEQEKKEEEERKRIEKEQEKERKQREKEQKEEEKKKAEEEKRRQEEERKKAEEEKKIAEVQRRNAEEEKLNFDRAIKEVENVNLSENFEINNKLEIQQKSDNRGDEELVKIKVSKSKKPEESNEKTNSELRSELDSDKKVRISQDFMRVNKSTERGWESVDAAVVADGGKTTVEMSSNSLPSHLEAKRLTWIQECLPWSKVSNEPWKLKAGIKKKLMRRPHSAKKFPPITEEIITAAARTATLRQVTTVHLKDLPGYSMTTLGQCWGLKCLTMQNCSLVAVEGLRECRQLQYLSLKNNNIEYIDFRDLGNLQVVDLSDNCVSVLHGFDGCTNIRWLDLTHNNITRLEGLDPLRRLHTLLLAHNQLINSRGLEDTPTLQYLDLSNNHLQTVDNLNKLCLLQFIDLSSNNLLKFPDLRNQVLLQECNLHDNSISSLTCLKNYWLPILSKLNMEQNSLSELDSLENCLMMKIFNIKNNQILDVADLQEAVSKFKYLDELYLHGNPISDEHVKELFEEQMSRLKILDGDELNHKVKPSVCVSSDFELMCLTQIQMTSDLQSKFHSEISTAKSLPVLDQLKLCEIYFHYCDSSFNMAVEHRYAHEYGDISVNIPKAPQTPRSSQSRSARPRKKDEGVFLDNPKDLFEKALQSRGKDQFESALNNASSSSPDKTVNDKLNEDRTKAAVKIQAVYRGYRMRKEISQYSIFWLAAVTIQAVWRGYITRRKLKNRTQQPKQENLRLSKEEMLIITELNGAATKIQAAWRGYFLRTKLAAALEFARMQNFADDDMDEFDMNEFNFDEENLEKGWRPSETPDIPQSHAVIGKPPSGRRAAPDVPKLDLHPPEKPRHAWRNADSPLSDIKGRQPRPPSSVPSVSSLDTHHSGLSKKEEKLSEEWGFHNVRTAELMLQRAKKMKYNADRRKKLNRLDPHQRLALFRKLEETTKLNPVRIPTRKVLPRKEYFQAKNEIAEEKILTTQQEVATRVHRTYEWLHTQVGSIDTFSNKNTQQISSYASETNLPKMDPDITAGKRIYLVNSPVSVGPNDSVSVADASYQRRYSLGENLHLTGYGTHLPQIKTHSAGSEHSREKMSWRKKQTDSDVGWGGGRKRKGAK